MRRPWPILLAVLAGGASLAVTTLRPQGVPVETIGLTHPLTDAPAMCPWRTPEKDMRVFFPGANRYETRTLVLSGLRVPIMQRLGPRTPLDSNVLYAYSAWQEAAPRGTVLVQRTAGEYGAIEVVVGVEPDGRVAGVRLQRYREPEAIADVIASPRWLRAFRGKTADAAWRVGEDIPAVPAAAQTSAETVVRTVRALLIELDVAQRHGREG